MRLTGIFQESWRYGDDWTVDGACCVILNITCMSVVSVAVLLHGRMVCFSKWFKTTSKCQHRVGSNDGLTGQSGLTVKVTLVTLIPEEEICYESASFFVKHLPVHVCGSERWHHVLYHFHLFCCHHFGVLYCFVYKHKSVVKSYTFGNYSLQNKLISLWIWLRV